MPPQPSQSQQLSLGKPDSGEGTSTAAIAAFRVSPSTPVERLSQIRRKKKRTQEDTFNEILQASVALDNEHRAWRTNSLEKNRVERRKAQEKERDAPAHTGASQTATQMLQTLVDLQIQQSHAHLPLQPIETFLYPCRAAWSGLRR
ncbi:unnamed protein product [Caretta caretta]